MPVLTVHRSAHEIGGNCIEIAHDGHRILLDAGEPLERPDGDGPATPVPTTLDLDRPVDAVLVSHPHQDHFGLLSALPADWPVWAGGPSAALMRLTASVSGRSLPQEIQSYQSSVPFSVGPFTITPHLTDHSAFDAHMLVVDCGGRRFLYSGDFRRTGRKAVLVDRMLAAPPKDVDVLLLEGTTLGRTEPFPSEWDLEERFVEVFEATPGRVFVTWSAQNIDRTVTIYRACRRSGRTLVLDLYAVDVLDQLARFRDTLPRLGLPGIRAVITRVMKRMYENPRRMNRPEFVHRCAKSRWAFGAAKLGRMKDAVVMLRPSLWEDLREKGLRVDSDDAWVFSMWKGYKEWSGYPAFEAAFARAGAGTLHLHTSGHATKADLLDFAKRIAPRHLVPIHSFDWDEHLEDFPRVLRLQDGQRFELEEPG